MINDDVTTDVEHAAAGLTRDFIRSVDHYRQRHALRLNLSVSELTAMGDLYQQGRLTPTALADRLGLTTGSVTALVDRLVAAGHVERTPNPDDRRSLLVALTGSGQRVVEQLFDGLVSGSARALTQVPAQQRDTILGYLRDAAAAFDETDATDHP